ncbi:lysophospholipase A (plasmid) [Legionella adelaidensis]|uniref:Lysophospholipase A n=1 Tax=Legionella adelaidensis TaxID=45056 RepID=A0A0W0R2U7_9GAMM|nr:SGNH/GDSL hydrolase family protein [Legionella adelaidensis]KTC65392.1 lysophospholipase A [Legionella adelaidensis]VEH84786.1 lysophospholipase A [Legionella adelaidensis]
MKILISIIAFLFTTMVSATPLHKIVVFGDSLSDNGNLYEYMKHQLPISPPYYKGRFTNGLVWVELLVSNYKNKQQPAPQIQLVDYAFGGASVDESESGPFSLRGQVDSYFLVNKVADPNSLYIVWIGSNNYLSLDEDMETYPVIQGIKNQLERLVEKGAKHFLIVNLPDLGKTPLAPTFGVTELLSSISLKHNDELASLIADYQSKRSDIKWTYLDVNEVFNEMLKGSYFSNVNESCTKDDDEEVEWEVAPPSMLKIAAKVTKPAPRNCDDYLFFDEVHPTGPAHKIMAAHAMRILEKAGEVFG